MSFGFSVGDFIAVSRLVSDIQSRLRNAPDQFKAVSAESLSDILCDLENVLNKRNLTARQKQDLHSIVEGCRDVLIDLNKVMDKYHCLIVSPKSLGDKSQRLWKKLRWKSDDITELRSRIISNISLLNIFNGSLINNMSHATKDGVDRLNKHQDDRKRFIVEDWLSSADFAAQQTDFISRRQEGTGQWLLKSNEFKTWLDGTKKTLFCPGIPGAGKTILTSIVIDHLWTKFQADSKIHIVYLYCSYKRQQEQSLRDLVASLLKQLVKGLSVLPNNIKSLYRLHVARDTRPSIDEFITTLHSVIDRYSKIFFVIDALDECTTSDRTRERLLEHIFKIQSYTTAALFVTSRFLPEITAIFKKEMSIEIRASADDVRKYLDTRITELSRCVLRNSALQDNIKTEIVKAVDGMFLLAQLHLDSLSGKTTPKAVRLALSQLPKGSKVLDAAYDEALERIEGQKPGFPELAKRVLCWITYTNRQLTVMELQHALAIEVGEFELDVENFCEIEEMVSVCAGLVTVDPETDVIRLVHYTTQEYFERIQPLWAPEFQTDISMACLTYISFTTFEMGPCVRNEVLQARLQQNVFLYYAAEHWGHHVRAAANEIVNDFAFRFLNDDLKASCSIQVLMRYGQDSYLKNYFSSYDPRNPNRFTATHLAAYFALTEVMGALLRSGYSPDAKDEYGRTPLAWAATCGHNSMVKVLLKRADVDADSKDRYERTPLAQAAEYGHEAVVRLLIERDDVNVDSKDIEAEKTPLSRAAEKEHEVVVNLLIKRDDVIADSKGANGRTPLGEAAKNGHEVVVKLLIERDDVKADSNDFPHNTPLSWAVRNGHEAVAKLLLKRDDVDVNPRNTMGATPLAAACFAGNEAMIRLLMERTDLELNSRNNSGCTPFYEAAWGGHERIVKLLMERTDLQLDTRDDYNITPLISAAQRGHERVVQLLLERNEVDPNSRNDRGESPLTSAARHGHGEVVKLLLERKELDPNPKNDKGETPLALAAWHRREEVVALLLERKNVDWDPPNREGDTPLVSAAENGYERIVKLLLERNKVNPNFRSSRVRPPPDFGVWDGHERRWKMLKPSDGTPQPIDDRGNTPLTFAAKNGHEGVVKLLLERKDVDPNPTNIKGETPLALATKYGRVGVVRLLKEHIS